MGLEKSFPKTEVMTVDMKRSGNVSLVKKTQFFQFFSILEIMSGFETELPLR